MIAMTGDMNRDFNRIEVSCAEHPAKLAFSGLFCDVFGDR